MRGRQTHAVGQAQASGLVRGRAEKRGRPSLNIKLYHSRCRLVTVSSWTLFCFKIAATSSTVAPTNDIVDQLAS